MYKNIFDAIRANDLQAVDSFLQQGIDLSCIDEESGLAPLDLAADLDLDDITDFLLEYTISFNEKIITVSSEDRRQSEVHFPETETEQSLRAIWAAVLGRELTDIHRSASFIHLGGQSLLVVQMQQAVLDTFGVELPIALIFENKNLAESAQVIHELMQQPQLFNQSLSTVFSAEVFPLSAGQQRFWFLDQTLEKKQTYNETLCFSIEGTLNKAALRQALLVLSQRHESLRTEYTQLEEGAMAQTVRSTIIPLHDEEDHISDASDSVVVKNAIDNFSAIIFDLQQAPLWRTRLIQCSNHQSILVIVLHHSIFDGTSARQLIPELFFLYHAAHKNTLISLLSSDIFQYREYCQWEHQWRQSDAFKIQGMYWKTRLTGVEPSSPLPRQTGFLLKESSLLGNTLDFKISETCRQAVQAYCRKSGITPYTYYLTAFYILLARYTQSHDIIVGTATANRHLPNSLTGIGYFVNTLPLRQQIDMNETFEQLLQNVWRNNRADFSHEKLPFDDIIKHTDVKENLFEAFFVYQGDVDFEIKILEESDVRVKPYKYPHAPKGTAKFNLNFELMNFEDTLQVAIEYRQDIFSAKIIKMMFTHYQRILESSIDKTQEPLNTIDMLTPEERHQQLVEWNNTEKTYPQTAIHQLFEEQVERTPDNIALVYENETMTYRELNSRANQVAHYLRSKGIGTQPDMLVGLGTERSFEMMIGLLAILKTGGAYVPLDPTHPDDRLRYMLHDTKVTLVLTQAHLISRWENLSDEAHFFLPVALDRQADYARFSIVNLESVTQPQSLTYVIYTSGSTGQPKGVMLEQSNVINYLFNVDEQFSGVQRVDFSSNLTFDLSVTTTLYPVCFGKTIFIFSGSLLESDIFAQHLIKNKIDLVKSTPALMSIIYPRSAANYRLKYCIVGGEKLSKYNAEAILQYSDHIIDEYGPTETTVGATYYEITSTTAHYSIGRPYHNYTIYVLDTFHQVVQAGVVGELYIGGAGVARGYLNRPELTAERFICHRFNKDSAPIRLYRTGDLVRYLPDGNIEYIGRTDNQIKIRGFRVELEEIEAQLLKQPTISNAVVVVREQANNKQLMAYIVSSEMIDMPILKTQLSTFLPDYMIPTHIMQLEKMPLNVNGKIDKKALPAIDVTILISQAHIAPRTETEKRLAEIFAELLSLPVERIGLSDNFFHLGGHSLLSMSLLSKIKREWQSEISLKALFDSPTPGGIAELVENSMSDVLSLSPLTKQKRPEQIPLSFSQQRLWFLEQLLPGKALYQVPLALKLNGACNIRALSQAYQMMIARQESLRTRFESVDGSARQVIDSPEVIPGLHVSDSVFESQEALRVYLETSLLQPFNLNEGPLLRGEIITVVPNREYVLFIVMHHIITDGWSMRCYMRELAHLYQHYNNQSTLMLEPLSVQYVDYSLWQQSWLQGNILEKQLDYWRQQLSDIPEVITLLSDHARPKELTYAGGRIDVDLSKSEADILKSVAKLNNATLFMVMLSTLQIVLHRYSQQNTIVVGSPIANRGIKETENLIGFFVNTLALKADFSQALTVNQFITQVRETTLEAYAHQDVPFEQIVNHLEIARQINVNPIFQVMLAYQERQEQTEFGSELKTSSLSEGDYPIAKFDLTLYVTHDESGLHCGFEYSKDLFQKATIARFIVHFRGIIQHLKTMSEKFVYELPLLTKEEMHQQLFTWNDTARPYPSTTIHELFEAQVARTPDAIALVYEDQAMTYRELNIRANQVAYYLREQGIGSQPDMLVGLGTERSVEMIVGVLAILKAGGAYVPMDPAHPDNRLAYMLADAKITFLLTQIHLAPRWKNLIRKEHIFTVLSLDEASMCSGLAQENLTVMTQPNSLAYVLYTSGTTGKPKGVMITQHSLVNLVLAMNERLNTQANDKFLALTSMSFDIAELEWHSPLIVGASIILANQPQANDVEALVTYLEITRPSVMQATPSRWRMLLEAGWQADTPIKILVGGEALNQSLATKLLQQSKTVWNVYGPTETTIWSSCARVQNDQPIHIGEPVSNTQFYVLNNRHTLVPNGVAGELYIGGAGLARGYLNRPDLTAERFIEHRFSEDSVPIRLYRTGDLVRYLPDGNIEYIGRTDNQIKIRGFRVELEEIEAQLLKQPHVLNAVVIAREAQVGNKQLIAYVTSNELIDTEALKIQLSAFLPDYMIPSHVMQLEKMPLNVNGKVDKKALPVMNTTMLISQSHMPPQTEIEIGLARLWSKLLLLSIEAISTTDNFFEKGGNSILAMQFVFQAKQQLNIEMTIAQFYQNPSIEMIARMHDNGITNTFDASILPISISTTKKSLFLIHPIGGLATPYRNLLPSLEGDYAIYGVNYPNLMEGDIVRYDSFEALARDYIQRIKTVSPEGPYRLGGWSLGGNIALEMTRQLQTAGEVVELLLFLDTAYQVYREEMEVGYTQIFMNELLVQLDPSFIEKSDFAARVTKISSHLHYLLTYHDAQKIQAVNRILFIKCQGSLVSLASQRVANIDWSYLDLFNGLHYYFSDLQAIHVRDLVCNHFELFDQQQAAMLNQLMTELLLEDKSDAYLINDESQNIIVAVRKEAAYQLQCLLNETEHRYSDLLQAETQKRFPKDIESHYQKVLASDQEALEAIIQIRKTASLNIFQLLTKMRSDRRLTLQIMRLLGEVSPTFIATQALNLTQKLLVLRLISSESAPLVAASVLDETLLGMMLLVAQQMNMPLVNYLNVALAKNNDAQVGRAFNAALSLSITLAIPMIIYGSLATEIGHALGMEQDVINEWRPLAFIHILAAFPTLMNLTMEIFYQTTYQRRMPALGAFFEAASTLLAVLLFKYCGTLDGLSLGLSLSIGSWCKSIFYLHDFYRKGCIRQYDLFQSVPLNLMQQYVKDIHALLTASLFSFSNYLVLACLIASNNGALSLTGYAVARSCSDLINLTNSIIAATSSILTGRFILAHQFQNALKTSVISMTIALIVAGITSIALSVISGRAVTELFINIDSIPLFIQDSFFKQVRESAYYFIGLGLLNSLRTPLSNYLIQSFAYIEIQKITFFSAFILANAAIFAIFFGSNNDTKDLIRILFLASGLTTALMLYQWLKISDFQCQSHTVSHLPKIESNDPLDIFEEKDKRIAAFNIFSAEEAKNDGTPSLGKAYSDSRAKFWSNGEYSQHLSSSRATLRK